jgi:L-threonylcarbamoyladenylate synthase
MGKAFVQSTLHDDDRKGSGVDIIKTRMLPAGPQATKAAAAVLRAGGLVAFPTETVYGLGADAGNGEAVARLYAAKGRPAFNPLIAHVPDVAAARRFAVFDAQAERLAAALWPGPLTIVLPQASDCPVSTLATAGLQSIALRVPAHAGARDMLLAFGGAVVAPSANRSGHVSPTTAEHVLADLDGRIDLVIDGGPTAVGLESTIVACLGRTPTLLRSGGTTRAAIEQALGEPLAAPTADPATGAPVAPGQLASHYAPAAALRLDARDVRPGEALLAFGELPHSGAEARTVRNLSARRDLVEAAANLFSHLRALDAESAEVIAVMPIPAEGLGEAINDRLRRAAAPRQGDVPQRRHR